MKMCYTLLIVGIAMVALVTMGTFTNEIELQMHPDGFVDGLIKYQIFAMLVGVVTTVAILFVNPDSKQFLSVGKTSIAAEKEKWLGINGKSSWSVNAVQLLLFVSIPTAIFMFVAVKFTDSLDNFQLYFIPLVLIFSFTNSLTEELIFRFGIVGGLYNHYPKLVILIASAVLFGLPHFWGYPGGTIGVFMSGVLGYILCKATIETKGIGVAWVIHFVQDVIIFTALMMMNVD